MKIRVAFLKPNWLTEHSCGSLWFFFLNFFLMFSFNMFLSSFLIMMSITYVIYHKLLYFFLFFTIWRLIFIYIGRFKNLKHNNFSSDSVVSVIIVIIFRDNDGWPRWRNVEIFYYCDSGRRRRQKYWLHTTVPYFRSRFCLTQIVNFAKKGGGDTVKK